MLKSLINVAQVDSTLFEFIETPEDESEKVTDRGIECPETPNAKIHMDATPMGTNNTHVSHPSAPGRRVSKTPEPAARKQHLKLTPTPKLRHNDSQIQFATIDSSPPGTEGPDSQVLTRRQREVKERQHQEAATMFPDLRSSPRSKSRDAMAKPSRLYLSSDIIGKSDGLPEEIISPTLPPANVITTTFLGSSPTPWSSGKLFGANGYNDGPPSSPPEVSKMRSYTNPAGGPKHSSLDGLPDIQEGEHRQKEHQEKDPAVSFGSGHGWLVAGVKGPVTSPEERPAQNEDQEMTDANLNSEFEVFVDAPVHPCEESIGGINKSDLMSPGSIMNASADSPALGGNSSAGVPSFISKDTPQAAQYTMLPDPDDEVSAQIANDMEMALSQAAEGSQVSLTSASSRSGSVQKRKRSPSPDRSAKKRISPEPRSSIQVIIEKQSPTRDESDMHDCIVVASPAVEALSSSAGMDLLEEMAGSPSQSHTSTSNDQREDLPTSKDTIASRNASRGGRSSGRRRGRPRRISKDAALNDECGDLTPDTVPVGEQNEAGTHNGLAVKQTKGRSSDGAKAEDPNLWASSRLSHPQENAAPSRVRGNGNETTTGVSILEGLKRMLEEAKAVVLSPGEGREVMSAWMDLGRELQNAERRAVP